MPGPVGKEKQFGLPDDFSKIDVTILSPTNPPASDFPENFWTLFGDPQIHCQTCLLFKTLFISFGRIKNINLRFLLRFV